ncbi:uncharacterized protein LOC116200626 [Punica granatum]|uniref:Uncharacterized protein n=2 Tax=Punica granatum TaxID=22663 RepID=A0A218XWG7_PUNGR|nr:uncharacterized protein LOC116200626 [Punica granatum]OWM89304.1 hypothetical protein CDL15_Pgr024049 [Punica granatum]PKI61697.1 hypothetical protein CRG98_017921 [Punica granatum]
MKAFGWLALGLSLVFGCLFLALLAEVYYLLWWRKRIGSIKDEAAEDVNENTSHAKDILHLICLKGPSSLNPSSASGLGPSGSNGDVGIDGRTEGQEQDLEMGGFSDLLLNKSEEESLDAELMRLHNLAGPPRFLFTIKEESKEDMDSEDGKSTRKGSRTRSLSDLLVGLETQVSPLKPSPSPNSTDSDAGFSFNPPVVDGASPPPKFKFLRDAEEKLLRRLMAEAEKRRSDGYGSLLRIGVVESKERDRIQIVPSPRNFPSSSSQVLPLASSPTASIRNLEEQKPAPVH